MICPIHKTEYDEMLWCPMCLIDEVEAKEAPEEVELEELTFEDRKEYTKAIEEWLNLMA